MLYFKHLVILILLRNISFSLQNVALQLSKLKIVSYCAHSVVSPHYLKKFNNCVKMFLLNKENTLLYQLLLSCLNI